MMVDIEPYCYNLSELIQSIIMPCIVRGVHCSLCSSCPGYVRSPESKVQLPSTGDLRRKRLPEHDEGTQADLVALRDLCRRVGRGGGGWASLTRRSSRCFCYVLARHALSCYTESVLQA